MNIYKVNFTTETVKQVPLLKDNEEDVYNLACFVKNGDETKHTIRTE